MNHEQLWKICETQGITGTWLENLKKLYQNTTLRAITAQGLTEEVELKRGVRQGCPLSPALFALFIEPNAQQMEQVLKEKGLYKPGKPSMLFYADDMVLWAETTEELEIKINHNSGHDGKTRLTNQCGKDEITMQQTSSKSREWDVY